ncbi:1-deoxy-D-xylulose-5-phosphate synthase [Mediterraneibacter catenae]|uniref:1-deoxy-D-xylulose-5-phosphate synthase n=1 Tax=Mediterraneibacter catenae TaxID=2594882 RepID=A0A5M9I3E4_9FIRM|nr:MULTISPECIES: 1-deoxy-D-xylulose-5-phosphate synthase [Mediterraneibacter]KAA8502566.1 1-deoxy-D-xylulose-5-phosphate synthase [Mediterraneibacter catenae]MCF2568463.1 1-deoxy-D-xylulose-5-phosphate synthase [Mediterraneibacter glycyrrhizinilyticus]MDN0043226.1 1-deoxy-D-xylulose-5-phosphate synthase [Mediterraneibacter glycyrrhizinilyticus]OUO28661.1 1-deoxy-D-xylulose-5-phosphate synthase [Lachnoclostridium sp. An298]
MILEMIRQANDIKKLNSEQLKILADEIRQFLIEKISRTGGHLASNLGVVELTMALHLTLDFPEDKLIWDVGHQSYTHKLLTGRKDGFDQLRKYGGMSGFPKRKESDCDAFDTGHSSTSVSAGLGYVEARELLHEKHTVVSVIGDGSLTGGMAYEALNNASRLKSNFIIVLNDNNMSISENVGGMSRYLNGIRTAQAYTDIKKGVEDTLMKIPGRGERIISQIRRTKSGIKQLLVPGMFFEDMDITYLGPVDGHDIRKLVKVLKEAKRVDHAVLVHVLTKKGKGYPPAEENPAKFHGTGPFDIKTGEPTEVSTTDSYTQVFSKVLTDIAKKDDKVVAITAAMADGTGLSSFAKHFPNRFYDVGIAEEHAMTFAAGLAAGGMKPVFAVYSSFLQRAYDQTLHDVCLQNLPVVIAVDRAGLVGSDGETHQGVFDLSFLSTIPNMTVISPKNRWEMADMLRFAVDFQYPIAIRYPRGSAYEGMRDFRAPIEYGKSEILYEEEDIAVIFVGHMAELADRVRKKIKETGYSCSLVNARFVKPLDKDMLEQLAKDHSLFVTIEENVITGGFGEQVMDYVSSAKLDVHVRNIGISDDYVEHGNVEILRKEVGLDCETIVKQAISDYLMIKDR